MTDCDLCNSEKELKGGFSFKDSIIGILKTAGVYDQLTTFKQQYPGSVYPSYTVQSTSRSLKPGCPLISLQWLHLTALYS